jgi:hypothetical protein
MGKLGGKLGQPLFYQSKAETLLVQGRDDQRLEKDKTREGAELAKVSKELK